MRFCILNAVRFLEGHSRAIKSRIYKASATFLKSWRRITNFIPPPSLSLSRLLLGASRVAYLIELITSKFVSYISARLRESFRGAGESRTGNWEQVTGLGQQVNWQLATGRQLHLPHLPQPWLMNENAAQKRNAINK